MVLASIAHPSQLETKRYIAFKTHPKLAFKLLTVKREYSREFPGESREIHGSGPLRVVEIGELDP